MDDPSPTERTPISGAAEPVSAAGGGGFAVRILAGLALGLAAGGLVDRPEAFAVADGVGKLWLNALTMTVVPLVFSLLVTGIVGTVSAGRGEHTTRRALVWFAVLLVGACLTSAAGTSLLLELWPVPEAAGSLRSAGEPPAVAGAGAWLSGLIPANIVQAASETAMVPLVIFALLFGFAASRLAIELRGSLLLFFRAVGETMLVIVRWVLLAAPLGVFALAMGMGQRIGVSAIGVLAQYIVIVSSACLTIVGLAYALVWMAGGLSPVRFGRAALPAQAVALGTQSSLATLPAMIRAAPRLDVDPAVAGIVLPLAVAAFRAVSAAANVAVALYLARLHGLAPDLATLFIASLVAAAVSLAAVGLPAQVSFVATIGPVCLAMGVPIELLPLLLAVEVIPDLFRTVGNVTADLAVARLVASRETNLVAAGCPPRVQDEG